jgi:hypothetical protein
LTEDAQENAVGLYYADCTVMDYCDAHPEDGWPCSAFDALARLGWRFTEHGERIA